MFPKSFKHQHRFPAGPRGSGVLHTEQNDPSQELRSSHSQRKAQDASQPAQPHLSSYSFTRSWLAARAPSQ